MEKIPRKNEFIRSIRISRRFPNECWDLENFDKINLPTKLEICIIDNIMYVSGNNLWKKKIMNIKIGREI